jgi:raffinose/stachyose/melibiose transport system substrate-binding protein
VRDFLTDKASGQALIPADKQKNIMITVFPAIPGEKLAKSTSVTPGTGYGISAKLADGSKELEAAWDLCKYMVSKDVQSYYVKIGAINVPVNTQVDVASLGLEPLAQTAVNFAMSNDYPHTCVFDGAFDAHIATALNQGLQEIGIGSKTPAEVAQTVQDAFDQWKADSGK